VARQIVAPLCAGAASNATRLGPVEALTGPVARGEIDVVRGHLRALDAADADLARLYRMLAAATLPLARAQGTAGESTLDALAALLTEPQSAP
jgi:predicted short-subunit dehydrogenase-like oxidoreductase (DUF2520 family)